MIKPEDGVIERLIGTPEPTELSVPALYGAFRDFANNNYQFMRGIIDHVQISVTTSPRMEDSNDLKETPNVSYSFNATRLRNPIGTDPETGEDVELERPRTQLVFELGTIATVRNTELPLFVASRIAHSKKEIKAVLKEHNRISIMHSLEFMLDSSVQDFDAVERYVYMDRAGNPLHVSSSNPSEITDVNTMDGRVDKAADFEWMKSLNLLDVSFDIAAEKEFADLERAFRVFYLFRRTLCRQLGIAVPSYQVPKNNDNIILPDASTVLAAKV